jgi:four helix bundle protein
VRSSTSVGAHYRAACRAKSRRDFFNKLKIVEEEANETIFWLEMIEESGLLNSAKVANIKKEVDEILATAVASIKTVRKQMNGESKERLKLNL